MKLDIQKELFRGVYLDCLHTRHHDAVKHIGEGALSEGR